MSSADGCAPWWYSSNPIERPEPHETSPQGICLDRVYDNADSRQLVGEYGLTPHIPHAR